MFRVAVESTARLSIGEVVVVRRLRPPVGRGTWREDGRRRHAGVPRCRLGRSMARRLLEQLKTRAAGGTGGLGLLLPHRRVVSVQCDELLVRAPLDDLALVQDDDLVGVRDGGKAVPGETSQ